jgi:hypothetical protein
MWRIVIDELTPSQNKFKGMHHHAYRRLRERFCSWIMVGMANGGIPRASGKRTLRIVRYAKTKRYLLDRGNFIGGCKPLLDAAIAMGLIVDDTEDMLDDIYEQRVAERGQPRVELFIRNSQKRDSSHSIDDDSFSRRPR